MPQRVIAIGDVHGCAKPLRALVGVVRLPTYDPLIMLGARVNLGPALRPFFHEVRSRR